MKVQVIKRIKTEVELDVESVAKNLIYHNIDYIIDSLMDEFIDNPESYIKNNIVMDEDTQITLSSYIREELGNKLSKLC